MRDLVGKISFQGRRGAYSHQACAEAFPGLEGLPCTSFESAIAAVRVHVVQRQHGVRLRLLEPRRGELLDHVRASLGDIVGLRAVRAGVKRLPDRHGRGRGAVRR